MYEYNTMTRFIDTGETVLKRRYIDSPLPDAPPVTTRPGSHVSRNTTTNTVVLNFGVTSLQTVGTLNCSDQQSAQIKWNGIPANTYCKVDLTWKLTAARTVNPVIPITVSIGTIKLMYTQNAIDEITFIKTPSQAGTVTSQVSWSAIITPTGGEIGITTTGLGELDTSTTYGFDAWCLPLEPGIIS